MASDGDGRTNAGTTAQDRRDAARRRVVWLAKLQTARGAYDCRVSNISPGGARVRVPEAIGIGQAVTLVTPGHGEFFGVVAWERDSVVGIRFTDRDLSNGANRIASANKPSTAADGHAAGSIPTAGPEPPVEADGGMESDLDIPDLDLEEDPEPASTPPPTRPARLTVVPNTGSSMMGAVAAKAAANPLLSDLAGLLRGLHPSTPGTVAPAGAPPARPALSGLGPARKTVASPGAPSLLSLPSRPVSPLSGLYAPDRAAPVAAASAAPSRVVTLVKPAPGLPRSGQPKSAATARLIAEDGLPSLEAMPAGNEPVVFVADDRVAAAVAILHPAINEVIDPNVAVRLTRSELRKQLIELLREITQQKNVLLSRVEHAAVVERILDEMLGLGPLEPLLADDSVTDILVNGAKQVFVERKGKLEMTDVTFLDDQHVVNIALRIVTKVGRRIDESVPLVDARLPDGSRVNVIVPPLAIHGPMISIRKFSKKKITLDVMARQQNLSPAMATLLKIAARSRLNILISGGTGSGKTTLLNAMSQNIDPAERIITIEDAAELQLQLPHVGSLEARPPNIEGKGAVTMRDLFKNALRMRPDRIILGEIRGDEAFDVLQAMNTGHDGSLATIHASGPREALARLEGIIAMCGIDIPTAAIRQQVSSAIDMVVQISRMRDGKRRITHITEVVGQEGAVFMTQDLFTYQYQDESATGDLLGKFVSSGLRPYFLRKAEQFGLHRLVLETMEAHDSLG